jgi:hypothetical protein
MSLLSFNMAVPVKDNRESQIYFLSSSENVPPASQSVDRKYLVFKALQLVISLCSLMLFAYGMQESRNEVADMLKYVTLGGVTVYPLLFILLSIDIKRRPVFLIIGNTLSVLALFAIGGSTVSSWANTHRTRYEVDRETHLESSMHLRSAFLSLFNGFLYLIESLIMCSEIRKLYRNNN